MSKLYTPVFLCLFLFSCKQNTPQNAADTTAELVTLSTKIFQQKSGPDCNKPDTLQMSCANVEFVYAHVIKGPEPLMTIANNWVNNYLISMLSLMGENAGAAPKTVEEAAKAFFASHAEFIKDAPDSPMGCYTADCSDTLLLNNGKHLTLMLNGYTYTGGAHGMPISSVATFDYQTGKQLQLTDIVTDTAAFKKIAEKQFRLTRADDFKIDAEGNPGFDFDDVFQFSLPANFGLVEKGLYCYYLHYEVAHYAFGSTDFVIPYKDLAGILRK